MVVVSNINLIRLERLQRRKRCYREIVYMWVCLAMLMILNYAIGYQSGKRNYYLRKYEKTAVEIRGEEGTETNEPNIPSEDIAESHPYHTSGFVDSIIDSSSSLPLSETPHESSSQDLDLPPYPTLEDDGGLGILGDAPDMDISTSHESGEGSGPRPNPTSEDTGVLGFFGFGDPPDMDISTSHESGEGSGPRPNPTSEDTGVLGFFGTLGNAIDNGIGSIGSGAVGQAVGGGC